MFFTTGGYIKDTDRCSVFTMTKLFQDWANLGYNFGIVHIYIYDFFLSGFTVVGCLKTVLYNTHPVCLALRLIPHHTHAGFLFPKFKQKALPVTKNSSSSQIVIIKGIVLWIPLKSLFVVQNCETNTRILWSWKDFPVINKTEFLSPRTFIFKITPHVYG